MFPNDDYLTWRKMNSFVLNSDKKLDILSVGHKNNSRNLKNIYRKDNGSNEIQRKLTIINYPKNPLVSGIPIIIFYYQIHCQL